MDQEKTPSAQRVCPPKPWRRSHDVFTNSAAGVLDHATSKVAIGTKRGIEPTKKLLGEGFERLWPPLIRMDENTRRRIDLVFREQCHCQRPVRHAPRTIHGRESSQQQGLNLRAHTEDAWPYCGPVLSFGRPFRGRMSTKIAKLKLNKGF